ncbi:hypothetical protein QOZ80_5BG0449580 [Eleusine coracana subsp. coracana]|nr:hypothetical protein QOZ80_5BG0449580 [Eleusine coracana subsp. coracana]
MESGSNGESKVASDDEAVLMISPGQAEAAAGAREEAAVSPPAPAAASPKPYYECVFCKRGFTTAQALGGHMNIHRRDRAKPARESPAGSITTVSRNVDCYSKYRHLATPSMPIPILGSSSSSNLLGMYYPSPSTGMAAAVETEGVISPSSVSPARELSLFGAATRDHDLHLGLACHGDAGDGSRMPEGSSSERQAGEPERELDLELRLGCRPRH